MLPCHARSTAALLLIHALVTSDAFALLGPTSLQQSKISATRPQSLALRRQRPRTPVLASAGKGGSGAGVAPAPAQSTYYDVLGITMNTNAIEIKKAYAGLAKQYHPDVTGGDPASTEYFYVIRDAYEILSDETSRKQYNQQLLLSGYRPTTPSGGAPKGQELGMSKFEFYIVVILINIPGFLFLWAPLFGLKFEFISNLIGAK